MFSPILPTDEARATSPLCSSFYRFSSSWACSVFSLSRSSLRDSSLCCRVVNSQPTSLGWISKHLAAISIISFFHLCNPQWGSALFLGCRVVGIILEQYSRRNFPFSIISLLHAKKGNVYFAIFITPLSFFNS